MPRPPRRAAAAQARHDHTTTTPTRNATANAITAAIPPFMLETPPHAPFITTPVPPSNNPGSSIVPEVNAQRNRNARTSHQTPTANGAAHENVPDQSQISNNALGSTMSDHTIQGDEHSLIDSVHHHAEDAKQLIGLRDISSLATWTLSSAKPGCALAQLRHPSPSQFWQSDGPQPHTLTLHFFKLVSIVKMRIYLDFELDESYTPTKMKFYAGMSEGGLVEFGAWEVEETKDPETGETHSTVESIRGWIDVSLKGVGGRDNHYYAERAIRRANKKSNGHAWLDDIDQAMTGVDDDEEGDEDEDELGEGDVLRAMVVQVRICENHQNGKDTHVRGFQVFARDEVGAKEMRKVVKKSRHREESPGVEEEEETEIVGLQPADWMGDPEIR